ncbi:MAG: DUF1573 domain-containing protein [Bacteroidota bacterium]
MKSFVQVLVLAFLLVGTTATAQSDKAIDAKTPQAKLVKTEVNSPQGISWDKTQYDYGKIPQNVPAEAVFTLTNTSNEPLIITKVKGSCGCTATAHSDDPVMPGENTTITATYNAKKKGAFTKTVRVTTNQSESPVVLKIKGTVEAAE